MPLSDIPAEYFRRQNESSDFLFYGSPRLVAHIDEAAIAALGEFLEPRIAENFDILDLMSAYLTHLPVEVRACCRRVAGLGMNAAEMAANAQLTEYTVHNLNDTPTLPYPNQAFDTVLCTVSVQYLLHPVEVFAEVYRVLRPEGNFIVSFSNRCFPTKATRLWRETSDEQRLGLIQMFFEQSGGWKAVEAFDLSPNNGRSDPLFAVVGRRAE